MDVSRLMSENETYSTNGSNENDLMDSKHIVGTAMGVSVGIIILTYLITLVVYWLLIKFNTSKEGMNRLILCLISMAVGALLGDAVLNLIPEIFSTHIDSNGKKRNKGDPIISSTIIISSYLAYFILEKVVKLLRNNKQQYKFEQEGKNNNHEIKNEDQVQISEEKDELRNNRKLLNN
jgi:uncharacterized membrane-anchored protein YitT (DUF2179 family)